MAKSFLTDIQLNNNVLLNAKIQAWGTAPTGTTNPNGSGTAVQGQISSYLGELYIFTGGTGSPANTWVKVGAGTVTSVSGTSGSVTVANGSTTPTISLTAAYGDSVNPYGSKTANFVLAAPNGSNGVPSFRALVAADIPDISGTYLTTSTASSTYLTQSTAASTYAPKANPTFTGTVSGITSAMVGLGNVTNESKATMFSSPTFTGTVSGVTATHVGLGNVTNESKATMFSSPTFTGSVTSGTIAMGNNKITGLGTPTADGDAATKLYVDTIATGLHVHPSVNYATTGALGTTGNLVGGTITTTYNNGTSGVDATLTIATSSNWTSITIDDQPLVVNDRVLIKNQGGTASNLQNGIYFVTQVGAVGNTTSFIFKRALDADQSPEIDAGDLTYVVAGTVNGGDGYVQNVNNVTVGTTAIQWSQFSGAGAVPLATVSSVGIASFPDAQFSVSAGGAVSIDNLGTLAGTFATSGASALTLTTTGTTNATLPSGTVTLMSTSGNTTGSAATLTTTRQIWGQNFNGSAPVTGALSGATTITGTAATAFIVQAAEYASTSGQGPHTYVKGGYATAATGTAQGGNVYIWAGGSDSGSGTAGSVNIGAGENVNITGLTTVSGTVRLPSVQSGSAGFVKIAATTGQLSTASIAYTDLPTASLTGVTTDGIARKKTGTLTANSSTTAFAINHQFGQWVTAQVFDASGNLVEVDVLNASTSSGTTTFTFAVAPTTGTDYKYVIVG